MNNSLKKALTLCLAAASAAGATVAASDDVKIEHLGTNNTLVRVINPGKYLILPVQESDDDAVVKVIVDGKLEGTFNVRLAQTKVDYTVPFDLTPYAGKNLILDVTTPQSRSSVRDSKNNVCWNSIEVADSFDTTNREKFRPLYHHTPVYGWMNDPNGMVYKDGVWHLAFQWNPYGSKWQNMTWGQSTSSDLIHWTPQTEAIIEPDGLGMIFSGSSAVDKTGSAGFGKDAIVTMYTSAGANQIQSLAWSEDGGYTYNKYPGNPTLTLDSEARDPNMFWDAANNRWVLVLAHALEHEMLIFTSPDMKEWTLQSSFGKGLGAQDGVWECPDLFELPVEGTDQKKWVLICNLNPGGIFGGSATQYFVGDFDGTTFTPDLDAEGKVPVKWLDYGKDHYAAVSFSDAPDDRRTLIAWMSNWEYAAEVPTTQFRSANTLPREIGLFRDADGQIYASYLPSPEVNTLRGKASLSVNNLSLSHKAKTFSLPSANDGVCEIAVDLDARKADAILLTLSNSMNEQVVMRYDLKTKQLSFDRTKSGITDFSQDFPAVTFAPSHAADNRLDLRIFIDRSSIEVFEKDGKFAMTNLVFPNVPYSALSISAEGGNAKIENLKIYPLNL